MCILVTAENCGYITVFNDDQFNGILTVTVGLLIVHKNKNRLQQQISVRYISNGINTKQINEKVDDSKKPPVLHPHVKQSTNTVRDRR